jgi:hypothetical protein
MDETSDIDHEKLRIEQYKIKAGVVKTLILVLFGTFAATVINYFIQARKLEVDTRQAEMKYLGEYVKLAIESEPRIRHRFAQYFAALTISEEMNKKWKSYFDVVKKEMEAIDNKESAIKQVELNLKELEDKLKSKSDDNDELVRVREEMDGKLKSLSSELTRLQNISGDVQNSPLNTHIQTYTGKVSQTARRVRQSLIASGYTADYNLVWDLTGTNKNRITTNPDNTLAAKRILDLLQSLDPSPGEFETKTDPRLQAKEVHIFLNDRLL